jgi:hypothetical protein
MNDNQLQQLIDSLRELEQPEQCRSHIVVGRPANMIFITANQAGFIRIARACLEAASHPIEENDCRSEPVSLMTGDEQVMLGPHDLVFGYLQRMETWPEPNEFIKERESRARKADRMALLGCGFVIFLGCSLVAGIVSLFSWFGV